MPTKESPNPLRLEDMGDSPPSTTVTWVASIVVVPSVAKVADPPLSPLTAEDPIDPKVPTNVVCTVHGQKILGNGGRPTANEQVGKDEAVDHRTGGNKAVSPAAHVVRKDIGEGGGLDGSDNNAHAVVAADVSAVASKKPRKGQKSPPKVKTTTSASTCALVELLLVK